MLAKKKGIICKLKNGSMKLFLILWVCKLKMESPANGIKQVCLFSLVPYPPVGMEECERGGGVFSPNFFLLQGFSILPHPLFYALS